MMGGFFVHNDLDITMPIYRCIPYSRVIELLEYKAMYFRKVIKWEDTWEIPSRFFTDNEKNTGVNYFGNSQVVASNLYGTCWTTTVESDALWRIYSGDRKEGVCIQTTVEKLFQSIDFSRFGNGLLDGFIGPIRYEYIGEIGDASFFDEDCPYYPWNMAAAFIKRNAFRHENEIRFLVHAPCHKEDGCLLPLKDLNFIDHLIADPRLGAQDVEAMRLKLGMLGFGDKLAKSTLYDIPDKTYEVVCRVKKMKPPLNARRWDGIDFKYSGQ